MLICLMGFRGRDVMKFPIQSQRSSVTAVFNHKNNYSSTHTID